MCEFIANSVKIGTLSCAGSLSGPEKGTRRPGPAVVLAALATLAGGHAAAAETLKVVALGTSLTRNGGWQEPLRERLAACTGRPVVVEKIAKVGATSQWGIGMVDAVLALKPDIVLIEFAVNDAAIHRFLGAENSVENLQSILSGIRAGNGEAVVAIQAMNPLSGFKAWTRRNLDRLNEAHLDLAGRSGALVIDHRRRWDALSPADRELWIPDGLHPDAKLAGEFIAETIAEVLCRSPEVLEGRVSGSSPQGDRGE